MGQRKSAAHASIDAAKRCNEKTRSQRPIPLNHATAGFSGWGSREPQDKISIEPKDDAWISSHQAALHCSQFLLTLPFLGDTNA